MSSEFYMPEKYGEDGQKDVGGAPVVIFMVGDVMTGRGIDQVLPYPGAPHLYEPYIKSAVEYVELAELANGPLTRPVDFSYIWGDALDELARTSPDARIINLETAVTRCEEYEDKGINYRMSPANVPCLAAARIDCCTLANNHVLDWGAGGLVETIETLKKAGIQTAGAGRDIEEAWAPAVIGSEEKGRVIVFSLGTESSGIPAAWSATGNRPGVNLIEDFNSTLGSIKDRVSRIRKRGDIVIASVHWGGNWGYDVPGGQRKFACQLIAEAGIDLVHGHSSHHVKGMEVYGGKLILYGCGDFLNDYEGISGFNGYLPGLGLIYFAAVDPSDGRLHSLQMVPTRIKHFRVNRAMEEDAISIRDVLNRKGERFGTRVEMRERNVLYLQWN